VGEVAMVIMIKNGCYLSVWPLVYASRGLHKRSTLQ